MAIHSWQSIIETVRNGEPVSAEVANRAINQLVQRTDHLKDRQDAQSLASAIFISGVPLSDDVETGNAVYFNTVSFKFSPAYADMVYSNGYLSLSETSTVVGLVVFKDTPNSGTIVIEGLVDPELYVGLDCTGESILANLLLEGTERGVLYLASGSVNAGKLSSKPGLLNVPVCSLLDTNHLLVRPPIASQLDTQALRFQLSAKPATPDLILRRINLNVTEAFPAGSESTLTVGSSVRIYQCLFATPDTEGTLLATATISKFDISGEIWFKDVTVTKETIQLLTANTADYAPIFTAGAGQCIAVKVSGGSTGFIVNRGANSSTAATLSSYVSVISAASPSLGYQIDAAYLDPSVAGWLPANAQNFPDSFIPAGAKYGYNFDADPVLHQLFPESVVGSYVVYKDGAALPSSTVVVGSNGIWWLDSFNQVPWHKINNKHVLPDTVVKFSDWTLGDASGIIQPTDLTLTYTKLISGGIKVVTSLEADPTSPITITGPDGIYANSGPLVISAGFSVTDSSSTEAGSLVVKDVTGFKMKRGRVVEKIVAGDNISLSSEVGNGQGQVVVSVTGLDGKLEGEPDILAIDDVLIERDSTLDIFYPVMPALKNSSLLGRVDVPSYLSGPYKLNLVVRFSCNSLFTLNSMSLALSWTRIQEAASPNLGSLASGGFTSSGELTGGVTPFSTSAAPRSYSTKIIEVTTVEAGDQLFFRLARSASDLYAGKLGLMSIKYKFIKVD